MRRVIWDWNGTLLDDVRHCVSVMNGLLRGEGLDPLTMERYRRIFDFPVQRYYERLGFDLTGEHWERLAAGFVERYDVGVTECRLRDGAIDVLTELDARGVRNTILSAARRDSIQSLTAHYEITHLLDDIVGLTDHYARGKLRAGLEWLHRSGADPREAVLIGDTVHDHEVAEALGMRCVLLTDGHQDRKRLSACGRPVVESLTHLLAAIF